AGAARRLGGGEAERGQLLGLGAAAAAIEVVPNPVELADFIAIPRGRFRAARRLAGHRLVLFLGKLTPRKRLDVLIDAFASLGDATATLVIAGNDLGAGAEARRRAERRGVGGRGLFTGLLRCGARRGAPRRPRRARRDGLRGARAAGGGRRRRRRMRSGPRALAFLACPPAHFGRLAGHLRAAAPDAHWDFVCFYPPPENPGAGVRV